MASASREVPLWERKNGWRRARSRFRYWTYVANMAADPGIERVETDGPYPPGMQGTTHLKGGGTTEWVVTEVEPERRVVIKMPLRDARRRFEMRFDPRDRAGSVLTQRVSPFGPKAAAYLEQVEAGLGTNLRDGMRAVRDRIDAATRP